MRTAITLATAIFLCVAIPARPLMAFQDDAAPAEPAAAAPAEGEEAPAAEGEEAPAEEVVVISNDELSFAVDNIVLFLSAVLVILMQPGFAMVEAGFNASKNTVNILFKNLMDLCIGCLLFYLVGYGLMYPGDSAINGYFGFAGIGVTEGADRVTAAPGALDPQVDFLFQVAFAATAATIVSGAVAGRMKFSAYLVYSAVLTGLIYPISGMWKWGGGWLDAMGFADFAGSIVVHAVGGFAGLAGAIVLGPRIGRYTAEGKSVPMPGHNLAIATLGVFILWVGWFGFNPGSQLAFTGTDNTMATMLIALNTMLAAAAGGFAAMMLSWVMFKKPDLSMALNGVLAGLVGITANCDQVTNLQSIIIGAVAGVLVVMGIIALDKLKIDDPVGAFPVHGLCGIWGGVATGIFGNSADFVTQVIGSTVIPAWAFLTMLPLFLGLKAIGMLRVDADEEVAGLDMVEHGMAAYSADH
ncbi:Ammonium transporter NrgA [Symmachiella dynata]|uniref:Ammonium transporter n=2 Tax=Symmachiella dynata TaxID=2527995 RepID=A0A517ZGY9_9PLAN|nr:ammonium transporter [Symmachiella dynata]QDT46242.1 Ammonium transporter NrgA [Symmachiella dynata]QDU41746.1 Ammonium transporter NrgA [Symmachiella dynata]